jgi:hypothetical protein
MEQAIKDYKAGKLKTYDNIDEMFKSWEEKWRKEDTKK